MKWIPPLLLPLLLAAWPAGAVDWPECYCTDSRGDRVEVGERACLKVNGRAFLARCDKALNVTIWRATGEGCVSSRLEPGAGRGDPRLEPVAVDAHVVLPEAQS